VWSRRLSLTVLVLLTAGWGQQVTSDGVPNQPAAGILPTITFTRNWDDAQLSFLKIETDSAGRARYESQDPKSEEPYTEDFTLSRATRAKIFDLAEKTNFFNGNFDFKQHKIAFTGTKTLTYHDAAHIGQTSYNWSQNQSIERLTNLFIAISNTIEAGRKVDFLIHYDKLGLDHQLEAMEAQAGSGQMIELQLVAPALNEIASNPVYMHIAQQRARHLLQLAGR
jgi:hypothetical protein